mmetsp:Transcript_12310/g.32493  ORF Transcript_12310/g.32493 Transcript_12310/m.32493 type:complete len:257 (+) Transcript_12310:349-1119(+)
MALRKWRLSTKASCRAAMSESSSSSPLPWSRSEARMKTTPISSPTRTCQRALAQWSTASMSIPPDADSIMPLATALATASGPSPTAPGPTKKKGSAPRPVVMQVSQPYKKTRSDWYDLLFQSCIPMMTTLDTIQRKQRPRKNRRRKEGQASKSADATVPCPPPAPLQLEGDSKVPPERVRRCSGSLEAPTSSGSPPRPTCEVAWLNQKASMEAAQPFMSIIMPTEIGVRLPKTRAPKPPRSRSTVALSIRATIVEN